MARPAIALSPEERIAYPFLFAKADTDQLGVLVGEKAVAFFAHSKLPPTILGEIWQLADSENAGFLTRQQFDIALRLIGKAQRGITVNEAAISTSGPLCRLEGIKIPGIAAPTSPFPSHRKSSPAPSAINSLNHISNEDRAKYTRMFINASPVEGLLDGDKAREIFIKSKLSFDTLGQIWTLADTQSRGSLSVGDFCIAMHLIQLTMSGNLSTLPSTLPQSLFDSAAGKPAAGTLPIPSQLTGQQSLPTVSPRRQLTLSNSIRPQYTGQPAPVGNTNSQVSNTGIASVTSPTRVPWDISPAELAQSNIYFDTLDINRQGYITGDRAVPFMMESKLPGEILARIWDLADIRGEGKLNREEFAVAMRLIQDTLASGSESLLPNLPPAMVPPSLRDSGKNLPPIQEASDAQRDLLSLMDDDEAPTQTVKSPAAPALQPQTTGLSFRAMPLTSQLTGAKCSSPSLNVTSPLPLAQSSLSAQLTGRSMTSNNLSTSFGGLDDSGAKLGNLHTQLASTENALSQTRSEKARLNGELSSTQDQIQNLELKLSAAREALKSETPIVEELKNRLAEQRSTLNKLTADAIAAESELSALKMEKDQVQAGIMRDKEEARGIKKRMAELEDETRSLRATLESLRKDSRLQKGLVAISKKQAATIEVQKDEATKELADLQSLLPNEGLLTASPAPEAPAISTNLSQRSTNPFERMMVAPSSSGTADPMSRRPTHSPVIPGSYETAKDPFSGGQEVSPPEPAAPALSFGDAFRFDEESHDEKQKGLSQQTGFEDSFSAIELTNQHENPSSNHPSKLSKDLTSDEVAFETSQRAKIETADDSDDSSSDEDEIEDATPSFLPLSAQVKSPNNPENQFPALDDVEPMFESKLIIKENPNSDGPSGKTTEDVTRSNQNEGKGSQGVLSFGDDLEMPDFAADFGKTDSGKPVGATLEDFDSAFESLPLPSSENQKDLSGYNHEDGNGFGTSFDDALSEAIFSPYRTDAPPSFDESVQVAGKTLKVFDEKKGEVVKEDKVPPLPTRPSGSNVVVGALDQVQAGDSDAVRQICAMGFDRKVAIEALERDEGDLERALNHLLGS
ncbi:hypothetical protein BY996DRAFT_4631241 [Phakopsora pachyrhizi]|nr:hypothetical protein BY996DRAFT_4631241 [Phakopsora pachyrhizi]